jgi:hypothetical protein
MGFHLEKELAKVAHMAHSLQQGALQPLWDLVGEEKARKAQLVLDEGQTPTERPSPR